MGAARNQRQCHPARLFRIRNDRRIVRKRHRRGDGQELPAPADAPAERPPRAVAAALLRRRAWHHGQRLHHRRWADIMSELLIERRGAVEIATLNRPERLNALNEGLVGELNTYFGDLADRTEDRKRTRLNSSH